MSAPLHLEQLQLLLTERCNLTCTHCAVPEEDSPAGEELTTAEWRRFLQAVIEGGVERLVLSGGEALLRPDCLQLAEHAFELGADAVVLVSNGTLLPTTTVARMVSLQQRHPGFQLHVSIDAIDAAGHDLIRGEGAFDRTMAGLRRLRGAGGRVDGVHTVVHRGNAADVGRLAELARSLGARTWTVFPVAALGRGIELDHLRMDQRGWEALLASIGDQVPQGLELGVMGPTLGDEWTDPACTPVFRSELPPQACVGPDGAVFTCPPLRAATVGRASEVVDRGAWLDVDRALRELHATACPTCKYRALCTGVIPGVPAEPVPAAFGEPASPVAVGLPRRAGVAP